MKSKKQKGLKQKGQNIDTTFSGRYYIGHVELDNNIELDKKANQSVGQLIKGLLKKAF